ncbi:MAG: cobalamin biosynthesis protein [Sneathiellales bacterium]|nr:cobalamin biosynthesis protein [Sneathiellales bacterium]
MTFIVGFGLRQSATIESLQNAFLKVSEDLPVSAISILGEKAMHPAFSEFSRLLGIPVILLEKENLHGIETDTRSELIEQKFSVGSVAEAVAIAAQEPFGQLYRGRQVSVDGLATAAVAHFSATQGDY